MPRQTLREKIKATIERNPADADKAALAVCVLLEREIDLAGNGWFDNDKVVLKAIGRDTED